MQWLNLDFVLKYFDVDTSAGGAYFIGYYEDDLLGQAVCKSVDYSKGCATCQGKNTYDKWSKYVTINTISVSSTNINVDRSLFDIEKASFGYLTNFGLNFELSTECDLTDYFCDRKYDFVEPCVLQITNDLLERIVYSSRDNENEEDAKTLSARMLLGLSDSNENKTKGVATQLSEITEAMSFDFSDMDSPCLPCDNNAVARFGVS